MVARSAEDLFSDILRRLRAVERRTPDLDVKKYVDPRVAGFNLLINGDFRINQRGHVSGANVMNYFLDRWRCEDRTTTQYNTNSDFESASTGWTNSGSVTNARSATQKKAGTYSMAVTRTGSGDDYVTKTITGLTNGAWYRVSGWFYVVTPGASFNSYGLRSNNVVQFYDYLRGGRWQYLTLMVQASGTSIPVRIYGVTGSIVYVDELTVSLAPTVTFTGDEYNGRTVTIGSGRLVSQVIERANITPGSYTLVWTGTAQARVYDYGSTPPAFSGSGSLTVAGITGNNDLVVEFNTGTVSKVAFYAGTVAYEFRSRPLQEELLIAQRYYQRFERYEVGAFNTYNAVALSAGSQHIPIFDRLSIPMRARPVVKFANDSAGDSGSASPVHLFDYFWENAAGILQRYLGIGGLTPASLYVSYSSTVNGINLSAGLATARNANPIILDAEM